MPLFITATGPGMQGGLGQLQLYRDLCGESLHHRHDPEPWAASQRGAREIASGPYSHISCKRDSYLRQDGHEVCPTRHASQQHVPLSCNACSGASVWGSVPGPKGGLRSSASCPVSAVKELSWRPCSSMSCSVPCMALLSRSSPLGSLQAHKVPLTASDWG